MRLGSRFFSATAYAGRLYVQRVSARGPWDARLLVYWDEAQIDLILNERVGDRKVRTADELERALEASRLGPPALSVWLLEGLEGVAKRLLGLRQRRKLTEKARKLLSHE